MPTSTASVKIVGSLSSIALKNVRPEETRD